MHTGWVKSASFLFVTNILYMQKLTITEVLRRFKEVHGNYHDYSFVEATYKRTTIPVKII